MGSTRHMQARFFLAVALLAPQMGDASAIVTLTSPSDQPTRVYARAGSAEPSEFASTDVTTFDHSVFSHANADAGALDASSNLNLEIGSSTIHSTFTGFGRVDFVRFQGAGYSASYSLNIQVDVPTEVAFSAHLSAGGSSDGVNSEGHTGFRFYKFEALIYEAYSNRGDSDVSNTLLFSPGEPWRLEFQGFGGASGGRSGVGLSTAASTADISFIIPEPSSRALLAFLALSCLFSRGVPTTRSE